MPMLVVAPGESVAAVGSGSPTRMEHGVVNADANEVSSSIYLLLNGLDCDPSGVCEQRRARCAVLPTRVRHGVRPTRAGSSELILLSRQR